MKPRPAPTTNPLAPFSLEADPQARLKLEGPIARRLEANIDGWLLPVPTANPGMLEMFRVRDRQPTPQLVPWAGEFVGKYLISAIQALRLSRRDELEEVVAAMVAALAATQAEDGYLGPFPQSDRLLGNWDLWGHYHCLLALLMWHEATDDADALACARRLADRVCDTYLDTDRRVVDAGWPEMNMAILHGLGRLHRVTGETRYLEMAREIEKDWERAGDYLRAGLDGREFYQTPSPRWESLHDLQGLVELHHLTGEEQYRIAFEHHWRSIARWDRRNTGGFTSDEQATGDPYASTIIETCCTIAWMAITLDMLRLTGDARVADELELSTFNGGIGSQHPSGRWWTYNTPMDGAREASAHSIVFQARAGTPELNCCSVNGPRALGLLSEWAVMTAPDGVALNYYGPGRFKVRRPEGGLVTLRVDSDYPRSGQVKIKVEPARKGKFALRLRIPGWSRRTRVAVNGDAVPDVVAGEYLVLERRWNPGDIVTLDLDLRLRAVPGGRGMTGKVSLYRGPLLLAYDQRHNPFDEENIPALDLQHLNELRTETPAVRKTQTPATAIHQALEPWLLVELPAADGTVLRLCDFASAGVAGTRYRSWLPAVACPPAPPVPRYPLDGTAIPAGPALFTWTGTNDGVEYRLEITAENDFERPALRVDGIREPRYLLDAEQAGELLSGIPYSWRILATSAEGKTGSVQPYATFTIDPSLPSLTEAQIALPPTGVLVRAALHGTPTPETGTMESAAGYSLAAGPGGEAEGALTLDGESGRLVYTFAAFPDEAYSVALWARLDALPEGASASLVSMWNAQMDDPLRLAIVNGKLHGQQETGSGSSTAGVPLAAGEWHHLALVKEGTALTLYVDGEVKGKTVAPLYPLTATRALAIGGSPRKPDAGHLRVTVSDLLLQAGALSPEEIATLATDRLSKE